MTQTLLAFLAMMTLVSFSVSQHQTTLQRQRDMLAAEYEVMAHAVGTEALQFVMTKAFDRATKGKKPGSVSKSDLTPEADFGSPNNCWNLDQACKSVDMFHGDSTSSFLFEMVRGLTNKDEIQFDVKASVAYVPDGTGSSTTWSKRVRIDVNHEHLQHPVVLERERSPQFGE